MSYWLRSFVVALPLWTVFFLVRLHEGQFGTLSQFAFVLPFTAPILTALWLKRARLQRP